MHLQLPEGLGALPYLTRGRSRAINAENRYGEKGRGGMAASPLGPSRKGSPCLKDIRPGETALLGEMEGPGIITHIWITVDNQTSEGDCFVLRDLVLRMYWDEEEDPSVEVPLGDFFCCGFGKECLVNSSAVTVVPSRGLNTYFQMPFRKKARITLENQHANPIPAFFYQIDYCLYEELPENAAYFHASLPKTGTDGNRERLCDHRRDSRGGTLRGHLYRPVHPPEILVGRGEVKFYIDKDQEYPTICGTGMEDYFGGSWSFASQEGGGRWSILTARPTWDILTTPAMTI